MTTHNAKTTSTYHWKLFLMDKEVVDIVSHDDMPPIEGFDVQESEKVDLDNWDYVSRLPYEDQAEKLRLVSLEVLRRVRLAKLRPLAAEKFMADRYQVYVPGLRDFDLRDATLNFWTPEMVAAWIIWRSKAHVLRHFEPSFTGARVWATNINLLGFKKIVKEKIPRDGHELIELDRVTLHDSFIGHDGSLCSFRPNHAWEEKLCAALVRGEIRAIGKKYLGDGKDTNIPAHAWASGYFDVHEKKYSFLAENGQPTYLDIRFISKDILTAFKANVGPYRPWKSFKDSKSKVARAAKLLQREWEFGFKWDFVNREQRNAAVFEIINRKENWSKAQLAKYEKDGIWRGPFHYGSDQSLSSLRFIERILALACEKEVTLTTV